MLLKYKRRKATVFHGKIAPDLSNTVIKMLINIYFGIFYRITATHGSIDQNQEELSKKRYCFYLCIYHCGRLFLVTRDICHDVFSQH